jgi:hypothetical protein
MILVGWACIFSDCVFNTDFFFRREISTPILLDLGEILAFFHQTLNDLCCFLECVALRN